MTENVLWPAYFDATLSRRQGRRIPTDLAVDNPEVDEIATAVQQVGYDVVVERDVAYPRQHWEKSGRVLVQSADDAGKSDLLQAVAAYVTALRD